MKNYKSVFPRIFCIVGGRVESRMLQTKILLLTKALETGGAKNSHLFAPHEARVLTTAFCGRG